MRVSSEEYWSWRRSEWRKVLGAPKQKSGTTCKDSELLRSLAKQIEESGLSLQTVTSMLSTEKTFSG